ncbi:MAG: tripartite tricarboxylate transporter substrate binding protein [Polaromonas sp.]|nr:tripartite tricarboxylate transporter substrate binding protein [Polaromonas sp.]
MRSSVTLRFPTRRTVLQVLPALAGAAALPAAAQGTKPYPANPVRIIVPHPAGGPADLIARIAAAELGKGLNQSFFVENRPSGGSLVGTAAVAQAKPDGETLLVNASLQVIYPAMFKQLSFDPIRDFTPVTQLTSVPLVLMVNPQVPVRNVKELIAYARANPGRLAFGSSGNGGAQHLAAELFKQMTGTYMVHIPYRGASPALTDLIGGQVQVMFDSMTSSLQHIRSGKLRALAVTSPQRSSLLPDAPTVAESGVPGYALANWYGIWAPKNTPADITHKLSDEIAKTFRTAEMSAQLRGSGSEVVASTPEEFARFCLSEKDKWARIVMKSGAKID